MSDGLLAAYEQAIKERDEARALVLRYLRGCGLCIDCDGIGCEFCANTGYEAAHPNQPYWILSALQKKEHENGN